MTDLGTPVNTMHRDEKIIYTSLETVIKLIMERWAPLTWNKSPDKQRQEGPLNLLHGIN